MILIFFLCVKLSILHLCVSNIGYECRRDDSRNRPEIILIEDSKNSVFRTELNSDFRRFCEEYYNINIGSLEHAKIYSNVIQFAVPDYYDGKPLNNFIYAGNISKIDDVMCTKSDKFESGFDCHEIANLVSEAAKKTNDGHIYDIVQEMEIIWNDDKLDITHRESCEPHIQQRSNLSVVLLCFRDYKDYEVNIQPLTLIQKRDIFCPDFLNDMWSRSSSDWNQILAVLAPKPFEIPIEYSVPTIFYEAPYMFSENKTAFPNSMTIVPWHLLKYGFLKFIQKVGWQRVAIVTDDSEYSIDFEDELITLFSTERLVYTVIRCEDAYCEMEKISQELKRVSAKIVIGNVEEEHAQYLLQHAPHTITWLFRDMAGKITTQGWPRNAFTFSLYSTNNQGCSDVEDYILTGLSSISQAFETISNEHYNLKKREFYRLFADRVKRMTPRITEAIITVHRVDNSIEISSMSVNEDGAQILEFNNPFEKFGTPKDREAYCLVSTYDYHKPCDDPLLMFLMLIVMMFVLTILLILCYFDKTSPFNDIRYQNF